MKIVKVTWNDAITHGGNIEKDNKLEVAECISVGFLVKKTKVDIRLVSTVLKDGDYQDLMIIPRGWETKIEVL